MAKTEANPPMPRFVDDYVLQTVDADYLAAAVKPKQFINIDQSECIQCEGGVDICPWKCIHYKAVEAIDEAVDADIPGLDPADNANFIIDDDIGIVVVFRLVPVQNYVFSSIAFCHYREPCRRVDDKR